jgi:hypothetical protein
LVTTRARYELICSIIRPRTQSDRTSFWRMCLWFERDIRERRFNEQVFDRMVEFAKEAVGPGCKSPPAVFTSILKKELGYLNHAPSGD